MCFQVGQAVTDKDCKSKCVCQAFGLVECEKLSCASGEVCAVRDGLRGCQVKQGQCSVSHIGHLTSFDGMSGAIKAKGAFEVASLCDETSKLWFRVVVDMRVCRNRAPPAVATVYVFFKETTVAVNSKFMTWVRRADRVESMVKCLIMKVIIMMYFFNLSFVFLFFPLLHVIQVNGRKVSLPSKVTSDVSVQISGRAVVIERASAVRVTYSISQEVTVIIDGSLSSKMCGACGNFNDNSKDDMKTADGKITTDVSVIVKSWSAGDFSRW